MRSRMLLTIAAVTAVTAALVGCDDTGSTAGVPAPGAATGTVAPSSTEQALAIPTDAGPKRQDAGPGAALTVTDIRIGHHPGFERVVYDLGGTGTPGWIVEYADRAVQDGSGSAVEVGGDSVLEVRILGSAYPFDSGVTPFDNSEPVSEPSAPGIAGVYRTIVFEGQTQSFIGVEGQRPAFAVSTAENPARLIVDIATN